MPSATGNSTRPAAADPSQIELILGQVDALPTLSPVATQLLELSMDERSGVRDLVRLIESDPSLASRALAMVRRADRCVQTESVERAVVLLGVKTIRSLALSIEIFETFSHRRENESGYFDRGGFWRHALACGCAAQLLAGRKTGGDGPAVGAEEAFLCGLLHDLGKIVLAACFPRTYDRVAEKADTCLLPIAEVEREIFGLDHTIAGHRLAVHWKLPRMVEECVWLHHQAPAAMPSRIEYPEHVRLARTADEIVRHLGIGYSGNHAPVAAPLNRLGEGPKAQEEWDRFTGRLLDLVESRAEWIGLDSLSSREMFEEALARANTQLTRANARLAETNRKLQERVDCFDALRVFKSALPDEPSHEAIARAGAEAARAILPDEPVAVLAISNAREIMIMVSAVSQGDQAFRQELLPLDQAGRLTDVARQFVGWAPAELLGDVVRDRLAALLDRPAGVWRGILCQGRCVGAVVVQSEPSVEAQRSLAVLCDWVSSWLGGVESRVLAHRLNEELAEMNRRLVDSQAELARIRSLAMVGEMAAGAAHEMNNPLAVISGRAQMLMQDAQDEAARRSAELIAEHAHKASAIVTDLMEFAKPAPPQPATWPMADLLSRLRREWLDGTSLTENQLLLTISDEVPDVWADESQMRKLFDELIRNAHEATRESPNPFVKINCWHDVTDEMVMVRVEDNGVGMSSDVLERAADPFFSHRPAGRGRGLGLSRAMRYAEINGGRVRLSSRPGEGTVVLVSLTTARRS
ncbi:MAG TPA: HDOD domain-containing protein [Phycisphaerae bacterium]|nr:HDOD domain-containing protein [Phycisphaerae bacterium]